MVTLRHQPPTPLRRLGPADLLVPRRPRRRPQDPSPTRAFCDTWIDLALDAGDPATLIDDDRARRLLEERERRLKRHRAPLLHREYLELWSGAAGTDPLDYRWRVTQQYAREVLTPLVSATENAAKRHAQTA